MAEAESGICIIIWLAYLMPIIRAGSLTTLRIRHVRAPQHKYGLNSIYFLCSSVI